MTDKLDGGACSLAVAQASTRSAAQRRAGVLAAIDRDRYDVIPVGITRDGAFVLEDDDPATFALDAGAPSRGRSTTARACCWPERGRDPRAAGRGMPTATERRSARSTSCSRSCTAAFGEDGTIQGMLELARAALRRRRRARLARSAWTSTSRRPCCRRAGHPGRAVGDGHADEWEPRSRRRCARRAAGLGLPVFVKPARAGSSVGVSKVATADELDAALDDRVRRGRQGAHRVGGRRAARSRSPCSRAARRRAARRVAGEIVADRSRVLRLRGQVPRRRRRRRWSAPPSSTDARARGDAGTRHPRVRGGRRRGPRPRRLLPHRRRASSSTSSTRCPGSRRSRCSRSAGWPRG